MLTDQDKAHVEALCSELEQAQVQVGLLLHNARVTLRNVTATAAKLTAAERAEQEAKKEPSNAPEAPIATGVTPELAKRRREWKNNAP